MLSAGTCKHFFVFCEATTGSYCKLCGLVEREYSLYGPQWLVNGAMITDKGSYVEMPRRTGGYTRLSRFRQIIRETFNMRSLQQKTLISPALFQTVKALTFTFRVSSVTPQKLIWLYKRARLGPLTMDKATQLSYMLGENRTQKEPEAAVLKELEMLFRKVDTRWHLVKQKLQARYKWRRVCFIHYATLLYALLRLMGEEELCARVVTLKQEESKHRQNVLWAVICEESGWEYIPIWGNILTPIEGISRPAQAHLLGQTVIKGKKHKKRKGNAVIFSSVPILGANKAARYQ